MKFVKGDAIAGIIIIIINLLGGLAIGVYQLNMEVGAAAAKYSILTIGDGMVAQIPALLGAMSAGLIVTRVTDSESDKHLGDSIQKQFASIPRVLVVAGVICFLLSAVPGFPSAVFISLGLILTLIGSSLIPALRRRMDKVSQPTFDTVMQRKEAKRPEVKETQSVDVQQAVPLLLEMPRDFALNGRDQELLDALNDVTEGIQRRVGLALPQIHFHWVKEPTDKWHLNVFEVPIVHGIVNRDTPTQNIVDSVHYALRQHATMFVGIQETSVLLTQASIEYPDIVKEALRAIPMQSVAAILRNLIEEEVSVRNMRGILEALVQASQHEKDVLNLTEFARIALARQICHQYAPDNRLQAIALAPQLEEVLLESMRTSGGNRQLSLDPNVAESLRRSLIDAAQTHAPAAVIAHLQLRRQIRGFIAQECFDTPVLSYNELLTHLQIDVATRIEMPGSEQQNVNQPEISAMQEKETA